MRRTTLLLLLSLVFLAVSLLSGCAKLGPKFTQPVIVPDDKAIIYVYRSRWGVTGHEIPGVKMNDKEIVSAVPELVYFPIAVTPGQYTFTPKLFAVYKTTPVTVDARAGQIYYVELQVKIGHLQFNLANPDSARNYMTSCYRVDPKYARDARVVFDAPVSQSAPPATQPQTTETPLDKKRVAEAPVKTAQLYVNATPDDARVRIMNIRPKFEQGIALDSGRYHIEVASAGYETYSEWILLKAGEVRTLPVKLKTQAVVKEVQQAESSEVEKPSVSEASNPVPDKEIKAPARLDSEQKRIAQLLQSESAIDLRNGAKNIYYHHPDSTYLVQVAEQRLLRDYRKETNDRNEVDALAWLCKALAQSHDQQFSNTLSTVAESAYHRKVRSYAAKSLRQL